ncbi:MAG: hypothetical protein GY795_48385 [Desulfobacterales bacterium]|nr:hypothetical protein [Desulfobacterales bacterium]
MKIKPYQIITVTVIGVIVSLGIENYLYYRDTGSPYSEYGGLYNSYRTAQSYFSDFPDDIVTADKLINRMIEEIYGKSVRRSDFPNDTSFFGKNLVIVSGRKENLLMLSLSSGSRIGTVDAEGKITRFQPLKDNRQGTWHIHIQARILHIYITFLIFFVLGLLTGRLSSGSLRLKKNETET